MNELNDDLNFDIELDKNDAKVQQKATQSTSAPKNVQKP